jgi:hypothetical protein
MPRARGRTARRDARRRRALHRMTARWHVCRPVRRSPPDPHLPPPPPNPIVRLSHTVPRARRRHDPHTIYPHIHGFIRRPPEASLPRRRPQPLPHPRTTMAGCAARRMRHELADPPHWASPPRRRTRAIQAPREPPPQPGMNRAQATRVAAGLGALRRVCAPVLGVVFNRSASSSPTVRFRLGAMVFSQF